MTVWTRDRIDILKRTLARDLDDNEFELFLDVCKTRNLNPFLRHVYAIKRQGKLTIQTGIDAFRLIAERTGKYLGQTQPYWCGKDGKWQDVWLGPGNPYAAKIGVHKKGQIEPTWGIAYWDAYVAPGPFWTKAGAAQLSKCSESLALRKAFPEELSGLYTTEEMNNSIIEATVIEPVNVPTTAAESQPVLVFPSEIIKQWASGEGTGVYSGLLHCLFKDTSGVEWQASEFKNIDAIDKAISNGTHVLVYYTVDTGRRVITKIEE